MHSRRGLPAVPFTGVAERAGPTGWAAFAVLLGALFLPPDAVAATEELIYPVDVAVSAEGQIYVADLEAAALLRWTGAGYEVVARGEGLPRTPLFGIRHIAPLEGGGVVASDPATMGLYRVSEGAIERIPDDERFVTPWGVAELPSGDLLAVDRVTQRLRRLGRDGADDLADIAAPRAILAEGDGSVVHILTDRNVLRLEAGTTTALIQSPPFEFPHDFVRAPDGGFFVTDGYARCIWRVSPEGRVSVLVQGEPLVSPQGLAVLPEGDLLAADAHAGAIFRISMAGEVRPLGE